MNRASLKEITLNSKQIKGEEVTPEALDRGTRDLIERLGGKDRITLEQFLQAVASSTLRGTSQLFRVRASVFK